MRMADRRATVPHVQKTLLSYGKKKHCSHGLTILSEYLHLVGTKCKINKLLDINCFIRKIHIIKQTPKRVLKARAVTNILNSIYRLHLSPFLVPSKFAHHLTFPYT